MSSKIQPFLAKYGLAVEFRVARAEARRPSAKPFTGRVTCMLYKSCTVVPYLDAIDGHGGRVAMIRRKRDLPVASQTRAVHPPRDIELLPHL